MSRNETEVTTLEENIAAVQEEIGVVKNVTGNRAEVEITPAGTCNHCPAASMCNWTGEKTRLIVAHNPVNARTGDTVALHRHPATSTGTAIVVFGLPALLMVLGILLGKTLFNDTAAVIFAGIGLLLGGALIAVIDHQRKRSGAGLPVIVRILTEENRQGGTNDKTNTMSLCPDNQHRLSRGEKDDTES